jgi:multicomponent K+:H+ antiporter subunit A
MPMQAAFLLPVLAMLPFVGSALVLASSNERRKRAVSLAAAVAVAATALVLAMAPAVFVGEVLRWQVEWMPQLGVAFGFRMDGLAWLFALLISGIGMLIVLYAAYYLDPGDPAARFFGFLLLFMGAMLGIVLADNLVLLVVFWELTSISSFLLIGYWHRRKDAREGARMALAITGAGGLALLGGVILLGRIVGSYDLDTVLASGDLIRAHALYPVALLLVLAGAFTKSAQFPFHFWLPHAMAAPTPVSAYLHSATMVKAGVFLLARMYPALGGAELWFWTVAPVGLATLLLGAYIAIFQHDLKGLLAYSTISHLGLITLLFGIDSRLAVVAGVFHILNHATFKASLFMAAGIIDHEAGSRDMRKLNGLWKYMPITGALGMVAAGAMAGVPLLNGFLSKEMFFGEALSRATGGVIHWWLPIGATVAGIFSVAYSTRFIHDVFFNGEPVGLPKTPHEPPRFMRLPVEVLVVLCVLVGIAPALTVGPLLAIGAQAALFGGPYAPLPPYKLVIWHGFNLPLAMSIVALVGGLALYFGLQRRVNLHRLVRLPGWITSGGREAFLWAQKSAIGTAAAITGALESGKLQNYLFLLLAIAVLAGFGPWLGNVDAARLPRIPELLPVSFGFVAFWVIAMGATLAAAFVYRQRLLALIVIGALGLAVSLLFVFLSAPDLALTQLLVEFVTIILMMLALNWLPREGRAEHAPLRKVADAALAAIAGLGVALTTLVLLTRPSNSIAPYFLENSVNLGGGANVVNVILVDFRGYDTLGEITVLGIAGLVIYATLYGFTPTYVAPPWTPRSPYEEDRHPLMLALVSRLLLPLAIAVSLFLFLRGHNAPGGGFIAGLVLAIALILQYVANGQHWLAPRLKSDFRGWIGGGLITAGLTGVGSWFLGHPFLTSTYDYPVLPLLGPVPVASAVAFDLGVYLTVVGATLVSLKAIARLHTTEPLPGDRHA